VTKVDKNVYEEIEDLEDMANELLKNDYPQDAIVFEVRALRYQLGVLTLTIEEVRDAIHETMDIASRTVVASLDNLK
jgi:hypothetical protein